MRITLLALTVFLLSITNGQAGVAPDGFMGITWKASLSEAKQTMLRREGISVKEETPQLLVLTGGTHMGHPVERWELEFTDNHFQKGTVITTVPPSNDQYEEYYRALTEKYGKGERANNDGAAYTNWKWPVSDPWSGEKSTTSILLWFHWGGPRSFKVEYAKQPQNSPPLPAKPARPEAPKKYEDL